MIPGSFEYHRPPTISDAVGLLVSFGDDALILAGGHSLIPMMKLRMAVPEYLIDLQDISSLKSISVEGDQITLGAMVTQAELIASSALSEKCPILQTTSLQIADPQIRNVGTIGGNVANGDPGNDMPAVMQLLDATYTLVGPNGERDVKARDFYETAYFTERADDEILTAIKFTAPAAGHGSAYEKQKRKIGDYATAAAGVVLTMADGICTSASIGLTNVADTPLWAEASAAALVGTSVDEPAIKAAMDAAKAIADPAQDSRGPREFRIHVTGIMVQRAIQQAVKNAQ
ncbi:MAG: xanthine dehydrogenase family protein subunit M [Alphaproteobacteria bacterium]|nr:xanthine dehydrogenase family protein subunit M [Alphaproteobacteria bacterium]